MNWQSLLPGSGRLSWRSQKVRAFAEQLENRCLLSGSSQALLVGSGITGLPASTLAAGLNAGLINLNNNPPTSATPTNTASATAAGASPVTGVGA
ncbi:MAG: hypothetical protein JWP03_4978, partial [Phycisphaerales bacterium]|nr:hypothetical protein [Phycisphaerales bacterium]